MENLLITIAAAFLGGFLLQKLRVPGGMMLGSVLTVALLNINTSLVDIPPEFRFLAQCIAGAYIGMTVKRENFGRLKDLVRP
ncbi:AbrB family transcriptional regulator, partial [Proteiniclasticum sp.]